MAGSWLPILLVRGADLGPGRAAGIPRHSDAWLQLGLLLEPLAFERVELFADIALVEEERFELLLVRIDRRVAQPGFDRGLLGIQLVHGLFQPLDTRLQGIS